MQAITSIQLAVGKIGSDFDNHRPSLGGGATRAHSTNTAIAESARAVKYRSRSRTEYFKVITTSASFATDAGRVKNKRSSKCENARGARWLIFAESACAGPQTSPFSHICKLERMILLRRSPMGTNSAWNQISPPTRAS